MSGQAAEGGGNNADATALESPSQKLRAELTRRSTILQRVGVARFCACDSSTKTLITTVFETGESSLGTGKDHQMVCDDVDCTFGTPSCNDIVLVRNHERYHSEAAVPSLLTFFQEDGTTIRYVHDFVIYGPMGNKMAPLDQLGASFTSLWLMGKLKPVGSANDPEWLQPFLQQMPTDPALPNDSTKTKQPKKPKVISVRVRIVHFFIDYGLEPADVPAVYAVSEHEIYYRLDKAAARYFTYFSSFLMMYKLSTRIAKAFQSDRNSRLASVMGEAASAEPSALTAWGEPMRVPGFSATKASKTMDVLYSECLYNHLFQMSFTPKSEMWKWRIIMQL